MTHIRKENVLESSIEIYTCMDYNNSIIEQIVKIHMMTFEGFFLTFLGRGFLKVLYKGFIAHKQSGIIIAEYKGKVVGFLAYSEDLSAFYKYLIRTRLISFAWYSLGVAIRKPTLMLLIIRAFLKPRESIRKENYIELSSIGVYPKAKKHHIGTKLIDELKRKFDNNKFEYIQLETDATNNDIANAFYRKNGFLINNEFETHEGRKMKEYRWYR